MAIRWYRQLLRILPSAFRDDYGDEMCRVVEEHWLSIRTSARTGARVRFWRRQVVAIVKLAVTQRLGRRHDIAQRSPQRERYDRMATMEGLWQDARHSARSFLKQPGFTAVTVLTLGLGIGATTTVFSALHAVLMRSLPYEDADRIVLVFQVNEETGERADGVSPANLRDLAEGAETLSAVAAAEPWSLDLKLDGRAENLRTWKVSHGFFDVLRTRPRLGRTFSADDYAAGNDKIVVLGHRTWVGRFGGDPEIVGNALALDGESYTVVGVLPPEFRFPDRADAWIPRIPSQTNGIGRFLLERDASRSGDYMSGVARLARRTTLAQAQADADRVAASLAEAYPETNSATGIRLVPLREHLFGDVRAPLLMLFGAVGVVLMIACANVAGLMLARGTQRNREYALRSALGAGTGRLAMHVTVESLMLALAGCVLGVALTYGGVHALRSLGPDHLPRIDELRVDAVVLGFGVLVAGLSAFLSGVAPSISLSRPDLSSAMSDNSRGNTAGRRGRALRKHLVVAEVAAAVVLLIGAGLLVRSFTLLLNEELGFEPRDRLAVQVFAYDYDDEARAAFIQQGVRNIEAVPGVRAVALTSSVPGATDAAIASIERDVPFTMEGRAAPPPGREPTASASMVSRGYFDLMEIPTTAGRGFNERDRDDAPPVVIINEALARGHLAGTDVVGARLVLQFGREAVTREIVGVVRDVRPLGHESQARPEIYLPLTQVGTGSLTFVIRTEAGLPAPTAQVMEAIWAANRGQVIWGAATLESLLAEWLEQRRFNLLVLGGFAVLALTLAMVGVYAMISFSVEQRSGELGVRRALGGQPADLLGMVLREGAVLAGTGVALGLLVASGLTRFIRGMLFGVEPLDPVTFGLLALAVLIVAAVAALVPALRATRIDPMVALRTE